MLLKNIASQGIYLFAYDTVNAVPKTGDAANITGTISKDGAAPGATAAANPTSIGAGIYWQPLSQAETNANAVALAWVSSTAGVQIDPAMGFTGTTVLDATGLDAITTTEPDTTTDGAVSTWNFRKLLRFGVMAMTRGTRTLSGGAGVLAVVKLAGTTATSHAIADDGAGNETLGGPT